MAPGIFDDANALAFLAKQGWLPLVLADYPGLVEAYTKLFEATNSFFALPEDSDQKTKYQAPDGPSASDVGYYKIPDEKCIMTIRTLNRCPEHLREDLQQVWNRTGALLSSILELIARNLDLQSDVFDPFVEPCKSLPEDDRTPTMQRMFRYDRPEGPDPKVNAERHKDLGLLSLVVGHSPGLFAMDQDMKTWVPVEEDFVLPPDTKVRSGGLTATLLVGETLAFLSRGRYKAGEHGVVCAPPSPEQGNDPYRYSIVYALRPAAAPIFTMNFESRVTGLFGEAEKLEGESAGALFQRIRNAHWNVNIAPEIREKQKQSQRKAAEANVREVSA